MKTAAFLIVFLLPVVVFGTASVRTADALTVPSQGDARLDGWAGAKIGRFLDHRVRSAFARDVIFGEARGAFEHPDDDLFFHPKGQPAPWGMWKGEFWGKLMISACRVAEYAHDENLKRFLHEEALRLVALQRPDGYLGTYVNPDYVRPLGYDASSYANTTKKAPWCWNLWCRKYTMWGLIANWRLTGDGKVLDAAARMMDHEIAQLKRLGTRPCETGTFVGMPSSSVLKPLLLLYRATNKKEYLDFARVIVDDFRRADGRAPNLIANAFSERPVADWYPEPQAWAKAYEMMSCCDGILEWWRVTGDRQALDAMIRVQAALAAHETNPLFSVGYNDQFANAADQPNGISEPCDAVHWIRFNHDLWRITGESRYVDAIELAFYNAYLAALRKDGTWGARGVRSHGYHMVVHKQSGMQHQHCCVNNMPRCAMDVAQTIAAKDAEGTLYVAFYNDGQATVGGDRVEITGNYPVDDVVTVKITRKAAGKVKFRVPAWSARDPDRGSWRTVNAPAGESVHRLAFDFSPRIWAPPRQTLPQGTKDWQLIRWGYAKPIAGFFRTKPGVEIMRGPLLVAKAEVAGTEAAEITSEETVLGTSPALRLLPRASSGSWGAWTLEIGTGTATKRLPVCDYPSAGEDFNEDGFRFSVWF